MKTHVHRLDPSQRKAAHHLDEEADAGEQAIAPPGLAETAETFEDDDLPDFSTPSSVERFAEAKISRGRPKLPGRKISTTIRLDPDVLKKFRATGPGWQSRINAVLKAAKV